MLRLRNLLCYHYGDSGVWSSTQRGPRILNPPEQTGGVILVFTTSARARGEKRGNRNHRRVLIVMTGKDFGANSSETGCGPWRLTRPAATAGNELKKWQGCQVGELCPWTIDCSFKYS